MRKRQQLQQRRDRIDKNQIYIDVFSWCLLSPCWATTDSQPPHLPALQELCVLDAACAWTCLSVHWIYCPFERSAVACDFSMTCQDHFEDLPWQIECAEYFSLNSNSWNFLVVNLTCESDEAASLSKSVPSCASFSSCAANRVSASPSTGRGIVPGH